MAKQEDKFKGPHSPSWHKNYPRSSQTRLTVNIREKPYASVTKRETDTKVLVETKVPVDTLVQLQDCRFSRFYGRNLQRPFKSTNDCG
jgi:hypothetical protein